MTWGEVVGCWRRGVASILWLSALLCSAAASAGIHVERPWTLNHYRHRAWTTQDGAPLNVTSIAQTSDGYLWLAASGGLYRFDGERFELFKASGRTQLLGTKPYRLFAPRGEGLWVGYLLGGASFINHGVVRNYTVENKFYSGTSGGFAYDARGKLWAAVTEPGVYRLDGQSWKLLRQEVGIDGKHRIYAVLRDDLGTLWLSASDTLYYMPKHEKRFSTLDIPGENVIALSQGPGHSLWLQYGNDGSIRRLLYGNGKPALSQGVYAGNGMPHAARSELWITGGDHGVGHVASPLDWLAGDHADPKALEYFGKVDGLSSNRTNCVFEDAEGDIWIGTPSGVDRFSPVNFTSVPLLNGQDHVALIQGAAGSMWAASMSRKAILVDSTALRSVDIPQVTMSGFHDSQGSTWFGSVDGVRKVDAEGRLTKVADSPRPGEGVAIASLTRLPDGSLLAAMAALDKPAYRYVNGKWDKFGTRPAPFSLLADSDGTVWQAYQSGEVERARGNTSRVWTPGLGALSVIARVRGKVWIAGSRGVAWLDGDAFHPLILNDLPSLSDVSGLLTATDGSLWLHAAQGVVRVGGHEVDAAFADPHHPVAYRLFDASDGLPGPPSGVPPIYSAAAGTDGRLWFSTSAGVAWIDPQAVFANPRTPPVTIQAISADDRAYPPGVPVTLPAHTGHLAFHFAALSYVAPERVRFRYRLSGVDQGWRNSDTSRETTYTNLDPGAYVFQVIASNNDGVWNAVGATQLITVLPGPTQTWWFRVLCALLVAFALVALHFWRLRRAEKWIRLQTVATLRERERIARDLHDTLLQSTQGLVLQLESAIGANMADKSRAPLAKALERARSTLAEGRDRVINLRALQDHEQGDFAREVTIEGEQLAAGTGVVFAIETVGKPRSLRPQVFCQAADIVREALRNAFAHAEPTTVRVRVEYQNKRWSVVISDDGQGIPMATLLQGREGHLGLFVMRERAGEIHGSVSIDSSLHRGTTVRLSVPARDAYA